MTASRSSLTLAFAVFFAGSGAAAQGGGERVVTAEAPIVAGNAVLAKQRALADAFRQATESALAAVIAENPETANLPLTPGLAELKASLATRGQRYVRSYRILEQDDSGGRVRLQIEAQVDSALLRRELDRVRGTAGAGVAQAGSTAVSFLVGGTVPAEAKLIVVNALVAAGARAQGVPPSDDATLSAAATRQGSRAVQMSVDSTSEGPVRGVQQVSVRCELRARVLPPDVRSRMPALERREEERGFAGDETAARLACWQRAATALTRSLATALKPAPAAARFVTLDLALSDPAVLSHVLQGVKRLGAVSATEVRHLSSRQAEVRLFTRLAGPSLEALLVRELAGRVGLERQKPADTDHVSLAARVIQTGDVPSPMGEPAP
jgi:hypothetical protein